MVMGGDLCSRGHGFKSQLFLLDGHFSHLIGVKNVVCLKKSTYGKEGPIKK